jgi:hypothetical protein
VEGGGHVSLRSWLRAQAPNYFKPILIYFFRIIIILFSLIVTEEWSRHANDFGNWENFRFLFHFLNMAVGILSIFKTDKHYQLKKSTPTTFSEYLANILPWNFNFVAWPHWFGTVSTVNWYRIWKIKVNISNFFTSYERS